MIIYDRNTMLSVLNTYEENYRYQSFIQLPRVYSPCRMIYMCTCGTYKDTDIHRIRQTHTGASRQTHTLPLAETQTQTHAHTHTHTLPLTDRQTDTHRLTHIYLHVHLRATLSRAISCGSCCVLTVCKFKI